MSRAPSTLFNTCCVAHFGCNKSMNRITVTNYLKHKNISKNNGNRLLMKWKKFCNFKVQHRHNVQVPYLSGISLLLSLFQDNPRSADNLCLYRSVLQLPTLGLFYALTSPVFFSITYKSCNK